MEQEISTEQPHSYHIGDLVGEYELNHIDRCQIDNPSVASNVCQQDKCRWRINGMNPDEENRLPVVCTAPTETFNDGYLRRAIHTRDYNSSTGRAPILAEQVPHYKSQLKPGTAHLQLTPEVES